MYMYWLEEMASGSFNIDTFSWLKQMPLSTNTTGFDSNIMFAVGSDKYMKPYSFYDYTNASGFVDTSTLTTIFNSAITSSINFIGKTYVSTIPYTKWISTNTVGTNVLETTYPFTYISSFPCTFSTFLSSIPGTPPNNVSTFRSTSVNFGNIPSSLYAQSYPFNFTSTYLNMAQTIPDRSMTIRTSNLWIGEEFSNLIHSRKYNVFVENKYSLWVSTVTERPITWISTNAVIGPGNGVIGRTAVTRIPNSNYVEVNNTFMFKPQSLITNPREIGLNSSNFTMNIYLQSTIIYIFSNMKPAYDIFIPGENNFTFTLVPIASTINN